jgi:hypothetical protein
MSLLNCYLLPIILNNKFHKIKISIVDNKPVSINKINDVFEIVTIGRNKEEYITHVCWNLPNNNILNHITADNICAFLKCTMGFSESNINFNIKFDSYIFGGICSKTYKYIIKIIKKLERLEVKYFFKCDYHY